MWLWNNMSREKIKRNERIYLAWDKGLTYRQLAKKFKLDVKTVFEIVKRLK